MKAVNGTPMIEKSGTGCQFFEQAFSGVEKNGTGIRRRRAFRTWVEKNGTGMRALTGAMAFLAVSISASSVAQDLPAGYVIVEGEQATISINNDLFSGSGQAALRSGYSAVPMKIIDARQLGIRFDAMQPLLDGNGIGNPDSEGSGTGSPDSEGSGTGSPDSEGSGTGSPDSEGSGTGSPDSEGSGTGSPDSEGSGTGSPDSEGSGTGSPDSEGSGTGKPLSEGSGTGRPDSEGSGTGWTGSEGSGTGSPDGIAVDICISGPRLGSLACDPAEGAIERPMVVDGFAELVIQGDTAFVLVHQLDLDGSITELAAIELPVIRQ